MRDHLIAEVSLGLGIGIIIGLLFAGTVSAAIGEEFQVTDTNPYEFESEIPGNVYSLQIPFIENKGQIDENVRFYADTFAGTVFVTGEGEIVYSLVKTGAESYEAEVTVIRERLGSQKEPEIKGVGRAETEVNYFVGDEDRWRTDIPAWREVSFGEVYGGIELELRAYGNNVEKLFTVHPQGSVSDIKLKVDGAEGLAVNKEGELEIETELGTVKFARPVAYQEIDGNRVDVAVKYIISQSEYGFQVGNYDRSKTLIIDPALVYSTYLGGTGKDRGIGIKVDGSGNIYVSGTILSVDFPTTVSAYNRSYSGGMDISVTKLNPSGTGLVYSTYLGGSGKDSGCGNIALDSSGNVYVTGYTYSDDFPTTASAFQENRQGSKDAFITKLNPSGTGLVYSTYLGGSGYEYPCGWSIDVDSSGNAYVVGETNSTDFPTTASAFQENYGGGDFDAFITKMNPTGTGLVYSTFLGGSSTDASWSVAVDGSGNAYMGGYTKSTNFPTTASVFQETHAEGGGKDAFITKLNPSGTGLVYSTYLGGSGNDDYAHDIAIDGSGNAYLTGKTNSDDFPTASAFQENKSGGYDVFVTKLNPTGTGLVYSTYLGGSGLDFGWGFAADSSGNAYVTGYTESSNFPTASPLQASNAGDRDVFVTEIDASGSLVFSTYLGGNATDRAWSIDVDGSGNAYVTGLTNSSNFPTTASAFQESYVGGMDILVAKIDLAPHITVDSPLNQTYNTTQVEINVSANEDIGMWWYSLNTGPNTTFTPNTTITASAGSNSLVVYANDTAGNIASAGGSFTVTPTTFNIPLISGWNLISIPLEQDNWSITSVLSSIEGNYSVVFAYINGGWKKSTAVRNPLTEISLEHGYWIYMTTPNTLELAAGTVPSTTTINVSTGWNLVGYPSLATENITTVLSSINYSVVFAYINGGWKKSTAVRNPLTEMTPGYGYWIYASEAGSYEVLNQG